MILIRELAGVPLLSHVLGDKSHMVAPAPFWLLKKIREFKSFKVQDQRNAWFNGVKKKMELNNVHIYSTFIVYVN